MKSKIKIIHYMNLKIKIFPQMESMQNHHNQQMSKSCYFPMIICACGRFITIPWYPFISCGGANWVRGVIILRDSPIRGRGADIVKLQS